MGVLMAQFTTLARCLGVLLIPGTLLLQVRQSQARETRAIRPAPHASDWEGYWREGGNVYHYTGGTFYVAIPYSCYHKGDPYIIGVTPSQAQGTLNACYEDQEACPGTTPTTVTMSDKNPDDAGLFLTGLWIYYQVDSTCN